MRPEPFKNSVSCGRQRRKINSISNCKTTPHLNDLWNCIGKFSFSFMWCGREFIVLCKLIFQPVSVVTSRILNWRSAKVIPLYVFWKLYQYRVASILQCMVSLVACFSWGFPWKKSAFFVRMHGRRTGKESGDNFVKAQKEKGTRIGGKTPLQPCFLFGHESRLSHLTP